MYSGKINTITLLYVYVSLNKPIAQECIVKQMFV